MAHVRVQFRDDGRADRILAQIPVELREVALRRALAKAGVIMANEARRKYRKLNSDRWGKPESDQPLAKSVRRVGSVQGTLVRSRVKTVGKANLYAVAVEYGHEKWIFGTKRADLGPVVQKPVFRPAADETRETQNSTVIRTLRNELMRYLNNA